MSIWIDITGFIQLKAAHIANKQMKELSFDGAFPILQTFFLNHLESIFVDHDKKLCQVLSQPWHIDGKILENDIFIF